MSPAPAAGPAPDAPEARPAPDAPEARPGPAAPETRPGPAAPETRPGPDAELFERQRARLRGLAYRMLGTLADADDVVQDTWVRWQRAEATVLASPEAWLTTLVTRLAIDRARSNSRQRLDYVGPWLPEPLVSGPGPEEAAELAESLRFAFLTVLERLGPVERAVFLLADVFALPYAEIALSVGRSEVACRQIASRARRRLDVGGEWGDTVRVDLQPSGSERQVQRGAERQLQRGAERQLQRGAERRVVDELVNLIAAGDVAGVVERLAPGAVCISDGGATRRAARRPVVGATRVARLMTNLAQRYTGEWAIRPVTAGGDPGVVIEVDGRVDLLAAFEIRHGQVVNVRIVLNPDKLRNVTTAVHLR